MDKHSRQIPRGINKGFNTCLICMQCGYYFTFRACNIRSRRLYGRYQTRWMRTNVIAALFMLYKYWPLWSKYEKVSHTALTLPTFSQNHLQETIFDQKIVIDNDRYSSRSKGDTKRPKNQITCILIILIDLWIISNNIMFR